MTDHGIIVKFRKKNILNFSQCEVKGQKRKAVYSKRQSWLLITGHAQTISNVSNHSNIFIILPSNKVITYLKVLNLERGISDLKASSNS